MVSSNHSYRWRIVQVPSGYLPISSEQENSKQIRTIIVKEKEPKPQ
jgi:hypothetical protein